MKTKYLPCVALFLMCLPAAAFGELRVASVFADHMVLQRDMKAPVWGWADAGTTVTVSFAGQQKTAKANAKGYWMAELDPVPANDKGQSLTVKAGNDSVEKKDVLVGEVWVLSGQSNMARPLSHEAFDYPLYKKYYDDAEYPLIRFIPYGMGASATPLGEVEPAQRKEEQWKLLSKSTAPDVMSIGFFFAKRILAEVKVPVGLVMVAVPGTPQTAWMAKETLESFPGEGGKANYYQSLFADEETKIAGGKGGFKNWDAFETALDKWRNDPKSTLRNWPGDAVVTDYPAALYNSRMHPLAPLAFRGMLWHQGEAGPRGPYGQRMVAMIEQHRALFKNDFYFIFGTLTRKTTQPPPLEPEVTAFANIDESMVQGDLQFGDKGKAALVNFFDIGNTATHWAMKEEAGRRMSLAALDRVYGQKHIFTGPELLQGTIKGGSVTCKFRYVGDGLKFEPSIDGISGVVIVDKKGNRFWANVKVTAPDTLVISHPKVADAAAIYYGWHTNPHETLFNSEGFCAFAFSVGEARVPKIKQSASIVSVIGGAAPKTELSVTHVRRTGYMFCMLEPKSPLGATVHLKAYVPAEWKDVEVHAGEKWVDAGKPTTDAGRKFITVDAVVNGDVVSVCEKGHWDEFSKVKRF